MYDGSILHFKKTKHFIQFIPTQETKKAESTLCLMSMMIPVELNQDQIMNGLLASVIYLLLNFLYIYGILTVYYKFVYLCIY